MRRTLLWLATVLVLFACLIALYPGARLFDLYLGSHVVVTARGPVEIAPRGEGPPVLLVHGLLGGYDQGLIVGDALYNNGFEIIAVSRPGYLRTPLSTGVTPEQQGDALAALLDTLQIPKVVVVGLSAGGYAAIELALRHPDRVEGLVLVSGVTARYPIDPQTLPKTVQPSPSQEFRPYNSDLFGLLGSIAVRRDPRPVINQILDAADLPGREDRNAVVAAILAQPQRLDYVHRFVDSLYPLSHKRDGIRNDLTQITTLPDLPLEQIAVPTLLIHGDIDRLVPFSTAVAAQAKIPNAMLLRVPGAGHLVLLGAHNPEIDDALVTFCRKVTTKQSH